MSSDVAVRTVAYHVYERGTLRGLGVWKDAPLPSFSRNLQGTDELTVTLPRRYGLIDEVGEPGTGRTIAWGNRVDVRVTSPWTLGRQSGFAVYGQGFYGEDRYGDGEDLGDLVWRGTIEEWEPDTAGGVTVKLLPLDRLLQGTQIVGTAVWANLDPVVLARVLLRLGAPALTWAAGNPAEAGKPQTFEIADLTLGDALAQLRTLAGANWISYVTPAGQYRFFQPDVSAPPLHTLAVGREVTGARFTKSGIGRKKRIVVVYANGLADVQAPDFDLADPRIEVVNADYIVNGADAYAMAKLLLRERDRLVFRGTCTVHGDHYPIESIQVGDTVTLRTERALAAGGGLALYGQGDYGSDSYGAGGGYDYEGQTLLVVGLTYDLYRVELELDQPRPRTTDLLAQLARRLEQTRRQLA